MIAYRLHFDEATLRSIELVHSGKIGEARIFSSVFGQQVSGSNSRLGAAQWAGPIPEMGTYPINGSRMFFGSEPTEAFAWAARTNEPRFAEVDEMVSVLLHYPGDRLAQFTVTYGSNATNECRIAGTKGDLRLSPAFAYDQSIERWLTIGKKTEHAKFPRRDQFGGETKYFSDCILDDRHPNPRMGTDFGSSKKCSVRRCVEALIRLESDPESSRSRCDGSSGLREAHCYWALMSDRAPQPDPP